MNPYPHLRQIVVSTSMTAAPDPAIELISDDVIARVRTLKAEPGKDIWLCGGGKLAAFLADTPPRRPDRRPPDDHDQPPDLPERFALLRYRWAQ